MKQLFRKFGGWLAVVVLTLVGWLLSLCRRNWFLTAAILFWLALAVVSEQIYALSLMASRLVIGLYASRVGTALLFGHTAPGPLSFVAGLGGLLYVLGLLPEFAGHPVIMHGRDVAFLVRVVGGAFLILPLAIARLPIRTRERLGLAGPC